MSVNADFKKWATSYSGCDGGDVGSSSHRSIWLCGIEWGGGHTPDHLRADFYQDYSTPPTGYDCWQDNLAWIYNWQAMKLLCAMHGYSIADYKQFAEQHRPFVKGAKGFFKMNLYPIAFRNTSGAHWAEAFSELTGFASKSDYISWCDEHRLSAISQWAEHHKPKAIICLGKTLKESFSRAFSITSAALTTEVIENRELSWAENPSGSLVFLLPFMVNRNGLTRNATIQKFGERVAEIIAQQSPSTKS